MAFFGVTVFGVSIGVDVDSNGTPALKADTDWANLQTCSFGMGWGPLTSSEKNLWDALWHLDWKCKQNVKNQKELREAQDAMKSCQGMVEWVIKTKFPDADLQKLTEISGGLDVSITCSAGLGYKVQVGIADKEGFHMVGVNGKFLKGVSVFAGTHHDNHQRMKIVFGFGGITLTVKFWAGGR